VIEITDAAVLERVKSCHHPVAASTLALVFEVHAQTIAAALSRLEDAGQVKAVSSPGQPRGASGARLWVVA
jgi:Mn-dependent DtxR family transcriptional regulator